jgi:hypothetical protein
MTRFLCGSHHTTQPIGRFGNGQWEDPHDVGFSLGLFRDEVPSYLILRIPYIYVPRRFIGDDLSVLFIGLTFFFSWH